MPNFTPEDLLLYLYQEASPEMMQEVEKSLAEDWTLREKLAVLKASIQRLDTIRETPRTEIVLQVLNYAREKIATKVVA